MNKVKTKTISAARCRPHDIKYLSQPSGGQDTRKFCVGSLGWSYDTRTHLPRSCPALSRHTGESAVQDLHVMQIKNLLHKAEAYSVILPLALSTH